VAATKFWLPCVKVILHPAGDVPKNRQNKQQKKGKKMSEQKEMYTATDSVTANK
jgi:hypothetical protein